MQKATICFCLGVLFLLGNSLESYAQSEITGDEELEKELIAYGFLGISIHSLDSQLIVRYENRIFRQEAAAILTIIKMMDNNWPPKYKEAILISHRMDIPMIMIIIPRIEYLRFSKKVINEENFVSSLSISYAGSKSDLISKLGQSHRFSGFRLLLEVAPQLKFSLGGAPDPFLYQLNLLPELKFFLWPGALLRIQGIYPITNELKIPEEDFFRPGFLTLTQTTRLASNLFAELNIGYFSDYRYGIALDVHRFFFRHRLRLSGHLGHTGYASYPIRLEVESPRKGWQFSAPDYWNWQVEAAYRWPYWNLITSVRYGQYLQFEKSITVNILRQFDELNIGFMGHYSSDGINYGFNLSLPLWPSKYWKPRRFQVRPAKYFNYNYYATQHHLSDFSTGSSWIEDQQRLHPDFLSIQLQELLK